MLEYACHSLQQFMHVCMHAICVCVGDWGYCFTCFRNVNNCDKCVMSMQAGPGVVTRAIEYTDDVIDRAEGMVSTFIDSATGQATSAMQSVGEGMYKSMPKSLPPLFK